MVAINPEVCCRLPAASVMMPVLMTESLLVPNQVRDIQDSVMMVIGKRLFSEAHLLAMSVNVITAIYSISATISLVNIPASEEDHSVDYCAHGEPLFEQAQCAYANTSTFIGFITIWIVYFIIFLIYRLARSSKYSTTDLRFYLVCDMTNNEPLNKFLVLLGMGLTVICGGVALGYAAKDIFVFNVGGVGQILVFMGVNLLTLFQIRRGRFTSLCTINNLGEISPEISINNASYDDKKCADAASLVLKEEILIRLPMADLGNLYGAAVSHADIFNYLLYATLADIDSDASLNSVLKSHWERSSKIEVSTEKVSALKSRGYDEGNALIASTDTEADADADADAGAKINVYGHGNGGGRVGFLDAMAVGDNSRQLRALARWLHSLPRHEPI